MQTLLIVILTFIFLAGVGLPCWNYYVQRKFRKLAEQKYDLVKPLILKLNTGIIPSPDEITLLAQQASLRLIVYKILSTHGRTDLFPAEYSSIEKGAESSLVTWLEFPTELGRAPESIELMACIPLSEDHTSNYYVFKYLARPSRWASHNAWMIGVCGPYGEQSKPFDPPLRVYSRFNITGTISPEEEVRWTHEHIRTHVSNG